MVDWKAVWIGIAIYTGLAILFSYFSTIGFPEIFPTAIITGLIVGYLAEGHDPKEGGKAGAFSGFFGGLLTSVVFLIISYYSDKDALLWIAFNTMPLAIVALIICSVMGALGGVIPRIQLNQTSKKR